MSKQTTIKKLCKELLVLHRRKWIDVCCDTPHGLTEKEIKQRTGRESKIISTTTIRIFE